jgi:CDP-diacylglycerol--glycerol-3-phosphate 3-phosphatidyltransferase
VAAIFALIAFDPSPVWADLLLYAAVAVTVISGVDYFLGVRRRFGQHTAERPARWTSPSP